MHVSYTVIVIAVVVFVVFLLILIQGRNVRCKLPRDDANQTYVYENRETGKVTNVETSPIEKTNHALYLKPGSVPNSLPASTLAPFDQSVQPPSTPYSSSAIASLTPLTSPAYTHIQQQLQPIEYCFLRIGDIVKLIPSNSQGTDVMFDRISLFKLENYDQLSSVSAPFSQGVGSVNLYYVEQPITKKKYPLDYDFVDGIKLAQGFSRVRELSNGSIIEGIQLRELQLYPYRVVFYNNSPVLNMISNGMNGLGLNNSMNGMNSNQADAPPSSYPYLMNRTPSTFVPNSPIPKSLSPPSSLHK